MTATTADGLARTGPAIRAALSKHAPAQLTEFETEFRAALADAAQSFDTDALDEVLSRWWQVASVRAVELSEREVDQVRRATAGDLTGLQVHDKVGAFRRFD